MKQLYRVKITSGLSYECVGEADLQLQEEEAVVVRCERYIDCGVIMEAIESLLTATRPWKKLVRRTTAGAASRARSSRRWCVAPLMMMSAKSRTTRYRRAMRT